jgi:hypothetical protein
MPFLIIPNEVSQSTATIWVAAINEPVFPNSTVLHYGNQQCPLPGGWQTFTTADGKGRVQYQRVPLDALTPRQSYVLNLRINNNSQAMGSVTTLPARLPNMSERAFTVLLGSCYFGRADTVGAVGQTYSQLPPDSKPEIKILCGDQVYLDNPPGDFLNFFHGHDWLEARSFNEYANAWTQSTFAGGFNRMLCNQANFFSSDDHEFWNNAPDVGLNVPLFTARQKDRDDWIGIARALYKIFQTEPSPPIRFDVDPLSFFIADTRFFRTSGANDAGDLMRDVDFREIGNWTANLKGPGVLVLGQPFFDNPGGKKDYTFPNFKKQYDQLKQFLRSCQHSVVILTGDVHFGRVAVAALRPDLGTTLIEVISSPMQLVPLARGKFQAAPQVFGNVVSGTDFSKGDNHFLTLHFQAPSAQRASMTIRHWPITRNGIALQSSVVGIPPAASTSIELI